MAREQDRVLYCERLFAMESEAPKKDEFSPLGCAVILVLLLVAWVWYANRTTPDQGHSTTASGPANCEDLKTLARDALQAARTPEEKVKVLKRFDVAARSAGCIP